jgi:hypothetical protein
LTVARTDITEGLPEIADPALCPTDDIKNDPPCLEGGVGRTDSRAALPEDYGICHQYQ